MKKFLCLLLCLTLFAATAFAADVTPARKFRNQFITGGNGVKGTLSLTAYGTADWLEYLLPFTGRELQVRLIGLAQGKYTETNPDDDAWQMQLYAEDEEGQPQGMTRFYGDPTGVFLSSELVPEVLLTIPAKDAHIPYAIVDGKFAELFMAIDPLGLLQPQQDGTERSYSAIASLSGISDEDWDANWAPVLDKYSTELDVWLAAYGGAPVIGSGDGSMTMRTTYAIPAEDLKAQAKKIIGMLMYDNDLMALLDAHVTAEQKNLYLNRNLIYFYEYCIDALPLSGKIVLESELTAMGEPVGMSISLPLPSLSQEVTAPVGEFIASCLDLPYTDLLNEADRISYSRKDGDVSISVSSPARTISFVIGETASSAEASQMEGFLHITPAVGSSEPPLSAAFSFRTAHVIATDENEAIHDDITLAMSLAPDLSVLNADDPFRSSYADFAPISLELALNYFTKTPRIESATRLEISGKVQLRDAEIAMEADLRTVPKWDHENLPTTGGENLFTLSETRKDSILRTLLTNAITTMLKAPAVMPVPEADLATGTDLPETEPTPVPPMA